MSDDLYNGLDLGKLLGLVFFDEKITFNSADHDILCKNLVLYIDAAFNRAARILTNSSFDTLKQTPFIAELGWQIIEEL